MLHVTLKVLIYFQFCAVMNMKCSSGAKWHITSSQRGAASRGGSNYKEEEYKQRENRQLRLLGYCTSAFGYIAKLGHGPDTATAAAK